MSEEIEPTYITASYTGKIGNIPSDKYGHESPGIFIKEPFVGTDEERYDRQWELILECYDMYQAFKEEAQKPIVVRTYKYKPECTVPQMEKIRLGAIALITRDVAWLNDNGFKQEFKKWWKDFVKEDYEGGLSALGFRGSRVVNRALGVFVKNLKEKENE